MTSKLSVLSAPPPNTNDRIGPERRMISPLERVMKCPAILLTLGFACLASTLHADSTVVFNEIMYHPPTNEALHEWVELYNQQAVDMDLSGWSLANGISFQFAEGTILPGGGRLVVASSPATLKAVTGLTNIYGPFSGRLSNAGIRPTIQKSKGPLRRVGSKVRMTWATSCRASSRRPLR